MAGFYDDDFDPRRRRRRAAFDDDAPADRTPRPTPGLLADSPRRYDIFELERLTGIPPRTIRYYISRGLLAPAYGRGPSATYDQGHLTRLRMIARLKDQRRPLDEIRERLARMTDEDVEAELDLRPSLPVDSWRRIMLHPDIELNVRVPPGGPASPDFNHTVETIIAMARPLIERMREPGPVPDDMDDPAGDEA
jgi:DNA-binding transcriptional MerR regulator